MTVLPIVERELRVVARQASTYRARVALASFAMFIGTVVLFVTLGFPPAKTGRYIFEGLSGLLFIYCLAYGRRSTADCLSQEKREGTIGLLFLTDLKGADIVLGKLAATSLRGFYGLLAVFPVLAIPLLLGGITQGEFWRMILVLIYTFLLSLAIGMFGSALSSDYRKAMAANLLLLALLIGAAPAYASALTYFFPADPLVFGLFLSCPFYTFYLAADSTYKVAPQDFWCSIGILHCLSWGLLAAASRHLPSAWQERAPTETKRSTRWRKWKYGSPEKQAEFRQRLLDHNAFYWLASRPRLKSLHVWVFLGFMALWWVFGWALGGRLWFDPSVALLTALLLNGTLKGWVTIEAAQHLAEARKAEAFELLLTTPFTPREMLRGQWLALRRQFLGPLVTIAGIELALMWLVSRHQRGPEVFPIWLAGIFMLLADLAALGCVAMAAALDAKSLHHAILRTVSRLLLLPWLLFGGVMVCGQVWHDLFLGSNWAPSWQFQLGLWLAFGLGADALFGLNAGWRLRFKFRQLALRESNSSPARVGHWFRRGACPASELTSAQVPHGGPGLVNGGTRHAPGAAQVSLVPPHATSELEAETKTRQIAAAPLPMAGPANARNSPPSRLRFRHAALVLLLVLLAGSGFIFFRGRRPAPSSMVLVQLSRSNGPVQLFPSANGFLLLLPDGSLRRWGLLNLAGRFNPTANPASRSVPTFQPLGTNSDWVQAANFYNYGAGIQRDGTLWEWGNSFAAAALGNPGRPPEPVDAGHDWIGVSVALQHAVALRRDGTLWAWGKNSVGQLGDGTLLDHAHPVQVGTNKDWTAVACQWSTTFALRADRTLWVWGSVQPMNKATMLTFNVPTQVCRDTNWAGFESGAVRMLSGELWLPFWMPFLAGPDAEAPASSICRLMLSNAPPSPIALAFVGSSKMYQSRIDGTLWEMDYAFRPVPGPPPPEIWHRVDPRSDWQAVWGSGTSAYGLTADGTLWRWGVDPFAAAPFRSRWKTAQQRLMSRFGLAGATPPASMVMPAFQKQPQPLLRLMLTNAPPR